jgi:hypothetical protein
MIFEVLCKYNVKNIIDTDNHMLSDHRQHISNKGDILCQQQVII